MHALYIVELFIYSYFLGIQMDLREKWMNSCWYMEIDGVFDNALVE